MTKPIVWMMLLMAVVASAFAAMFFGSATISVAAGLEPDHW